MEELCQLATRIILCQLATKICTQYFLGVWVLKYKVFITLSKKLDKKRLIIYDLCHEL